MSADPHASAVTAGTAPRRRPQADLAGSAPMPSGRPTALPLKHAPCCGFAVVHTVRPRAVVWGARGGTWWGLPRPWRPAPTGRRAGRCATSMGPEIRPQCIGHWGYACGPAKVATMGDVASPSRGRSIAPSAATWPRGTRWRRYPWRRLTRGRSPRMAVSMPWRSRPARPGQDGIRRLGVDRRERGGKRPRPPVSADGKPGVWGPSSRYRRPPPPHMAAPLVPGSGAQGAQDCGWVRTQSCPPAQSSPGGVPARAGVSQWCRRSDAGRFDRWSCADSAI